MRFLFKEGQRGFMRLKSAKLKIVFGFNLVLFVTLQTAIAQNYSNGGGIGNGGSVAISITSPAGDIEYLEGDDFATQVLHNPWDFNQLSDFGFDFGFSPVGVSSDGIWSGTAIKGDGTVNAVYPLFSGINGIPLASGLPGDKDVPISGRMRPIDTSRYTLLSFREDSTTRVAGQNADSSFGVWWESRLDKYGIQPDATSPNAYFADGVVNAVSTPNSFWSRPAGWNLYTFDLCPDKTCPWKTASSVHSLKLAPVIGLTGNADVKFDWIRLVVPDSAPFYQMTFSFPSLLSITSTAMIGLFVDSDNQGYDGDPLLFLPAASNIDFSNLSGAVSFPSAALPPGDHYLYVAIVRYQGDPIPTYSDYRKLTIKPRPELSFTTPSISSNDYATTDLGNAWDMSGPEDIWNIPTSDLLRPRNLINFVFDSASIDKYFIKLTDGTNIFSSFSKAAKVKNHKLSLSSNRTFSAFDPVDVEELGFGDPTISTSLWLPTTKTNAIAAKKYRYLNVKFQVGNDNDPIVSRLSQGWLSGVDYSNLGELDGGAVRSQVYFPGWHTYSFDLWDSQNPNKYLFHGNPWTGNYLNIWLQVLKNNTPNDVPFKVADVKLIEQPIASGYYTIGFDIENPGNASTAKLYYVNANDTSKAELPIGVVSLSSSVKSYTYNWDVSKLLSGSYYVVGKVIKMIGTTEVVLNTSVAGVPVVVGSSSSVRKPVPLDYNGDFISDEAVVRSIEGKFYQNRSNPGADSIPVVQQWVTGSDFHPLRADFDGDGKTDLAVVFNYYGSLGWYIAESKTNTVRALLWGKPGDQLVPADYDGDGKAEVAVMRNGEWCILDIGADGSLLATVRYWGESDDFGVPADFDGDGLADLAIYRTNPDNSKSWWILFSSYKDGDEELPYFGIANWGSIFDVPLAADWNGDGKADFAVYRPSTGEWFFVDNTSTSAYVLQWGLPGDIPVVGDFNGDGNLEPSVFRPSTGSWYHRYQNFEWRYVQFGLPGDRLPGGIDYLP